MSFQTDDVAIIMKGEEWFAVLVKFNDLLAGKNTPDEALFSRSGLKVYRSGRAKLESQLLAASAAAPQRKRKKPDAPPQS